MLADDCPALGHVDNDAFRPRHARLAHAARDYGGMRCLTAATGQNAFGGKKTVDVFRSGLLTHEDDLFAAVTELFRQVGVEDALARGTSRRRRQAGCHRPGRAVRVEARV